MKMNNVILFPAENKALTVDVKKYVSIKLLIKGLIFKILWYQSTSGNYKTIFK